jgi:hypothetical protein
MTDYAFCEPVTAGSGTAIHIRRLTKETGLRPSGGADTLALCGRVVAWDLAGGVTPASLQSHQTCSECRSKFKRAVTPERVQ